MAPAINSAPCFIPRFPMPDSFAVSDRTRVVREANRAVYDREAIYKILDEGFVCHVGFAAEGQPFVIPTMFARVGDSIYFHGVRRRAGCCARSRDCPVCITVTFDGMGWCWRGLVFNHSMNYRSVVALGTGHAGQAIPRKNQRAAGVHGEADSRPRGDGKMRGSRTNKSGKTTPSILKLPLTEVSAKVRIGGVEDDARGLRASPCGRGLFRCGWVWRTRRILR